MMVSCRTYSPDLILLNHRLGLNKGKAHATTFLWGGQETYIDVFASNHQTAPHHRAGAISRGLVPGLQRLTEDHGTCISSCLDYWDDDLVIQAFNRCLILAPEIYGNPWLLRDDEYPKLARIYKLHKKYRDIMVDGLELPESFGPYAVSRGDEKQRLITLRNLSWNDTVYTITIDSIMGLEAADKFEVRQFHPTEKLLGVYEYGGLLKIQVPSFRSCLLLVGSIGCDEVGVDGLDFNVIQDVAGKPVQIELLGLPGTIGSFSILQAETYGEVRLDGQLLTSIDQPSDIEFQGKALKEAHHRKLGNLEEVAIPDEVAALYEATVFAADNNALEVRSIQRSGWSDVPEVQKAQQAFFQQDVFVDRGIWDKNLFDGNPNTGFWPSEKYGVDQKVKGGCFRLDMGELLTIDTLVLYVPDYFSLQPLLKDEAYYAEISTDLHSWQTITFMADTLIYIPINTKARYLKINYFPQQLVEIEGVHNGRIVDNSHWRTSNLFARSQRMKAQKVWSTEVKLKEMAKGSYLSIAINGEHGVEGAYAAVVVDGQIMGCPDRAVSFPSNTWEYVNARSNKNYTYYFPLSEEMVAKEIRVYVIAYEEGKLDLNPELWISANPIPFEKRILELERR